MTATTLYAPTGPLRARWREQSGFQMADMLFAMVIAGITATIALGVLVSTGLLVTKSMATTTTLSQLEDASGLLLRDVNDGRKIVVAEPDALTVQVTRDSVCTQRAWTIDGGDLVVTTDTFSSERCTGGSETSRMEVVQDEFTATEPFHYFSALSQTNEMPSPVSLNDVTRVTWDLSALPSYPDAREVEITSGAAFTGRGASSDGTGQVQDATRPLLQVTTARVGVDKPVLEWTDTSPELTESWTVFRIANAEGTASGTATTWTAVMHLGAGMLTWTDTTLPPGYTAQYTVQATLGDGRQGPTSNQASTGLRPAAPTLTATGRQAFIALSWNRTEGADAWDIYRDGTLYRNWAQIEGAASVSGSSVAWSDQTGVGHSHDYRVVARNRWEAAATDPAGASSGSAQRNVVPAGTSATAELGEPGLRAARLISSAAGAWSSPVAPTGLTINNRLPATDQANPASTWDATVDLRWAASAWTGGYADAARAATRYAVSRGGATVRAGMTAVSTTDTGAPRGVTSAYVITASTVAPHALTGAATMGTLLTWPAAPACTAAAGGGGHPATRAATITVAGPSGQTVTAQRQRITSGEVRAAASSAWTELTHDTGYAWRGQASNAAGWGPWSGECSIRTQVLTVATPATPSCWANSAPQYAPGSINWGVSAGANLTSGASYASGAGTYYCNASRTNTNSDGYNTVSSTRTGSGSVYVDANPYPSGWGDRAGCPAVGIYITPTSPTAFQVRRVDAVNCQARLVLTQAGADADPTGALPGTVRAMYATTVGGSLWTRTSGTGPATAPAV